MTHSFALTLPYYPWDRLTDFRRRAGEHPDGVCDLSIGTPVDPTPEVIRRALSEAGDAHGYPTTAGTTELREAIADWYETWHSVTLDPATEILPTVGSKELVAWLPTLLGLRQRGLAVACPSAAYPTYEMGARRGRRGRRGGFARGHRPGVDQRSEQSDRRGAQHRDPRRGRRPCPGRRNRARLGRMLWTAQLGIERSRTECALGRPGVPVRSAQRLLDVEAVESRRLPCRLRRRGCRPHRRSHPFTQARGDDRALPDPGGDDRGAQGHRSCARPEAAVPLTQESAALGSRRLRVPHRSFDRRSLPVVDDRTELLGLPCPAL